VPAPGALAGAADGGSPKGADSAVLAGLPGKDHVFGVDVRIELQRTFVAA